jgi:hypothetical protein
MQSFYVVCWINAAILCPAVVVAQSPVTLTINTHAPGYMVPTNFVGLSMGVETEQADHRGVAGNIFSAADTQVVTLFQNMGLHSLRFGGGATLSDSDIDVLFTFQSALTNLQIIYQLPFDTIPDAVTTVQYIWTNYQSHNK